MNIHLVRVRLAEAAGAIVGLESLPYIPYLLPEPCFFVGEVDIEFDKAMNRGLDEATVTCRLLVSKADDLSGQELLDGYLAGDGATSVKAALEAARGAPGQSALSGACHDFRLIRVQGYGHYTHGANTYLGAEFIVQVIGSGDE